MLSSTIRESRLLVRSWRSEAESVLGIRTCCRSLWRLSPNPHGGANKDAVTPALPRPSRTRLAASDSPPARYRLVHPGVEVRDVLLVRLGPAVAPANLLEDSQLLAVFGVAVRRRWGASRRAPRLSHFSPWLAARLVRGAGGCTQRTRNRLPAVIGCSTP